MQKREGRFAAIVRRWLRVKLHGDPESMCECPFCGGATSLQFNVQNGLWICFRCDERGTAKKLVQKLGGRYEHPIAQIDELEERLNELERELGREKKQTVLAESTLGRYKGPAHEYWTDKRRFSDKTIAYWELGYDPITDRCTIPYRSPDGDLLGVIYRRLDDQFPRYNYPEGFDRKGSLFGSWKFGHGDSPDNAVLVEGSTDAMWVREAGFPSLGQYGSSLHPNQVRLLHQLGITELTLFYDFDAAGLKAFKQAPTVLDGFTMRRTYYDGTKYCWHEKLCGCRDNHNPADIGAMAKCPRKVRCLCGRKHCPDPGSLSKREIRAMVRGSQLVGKEREWPSSRRSRRSVVSRAAAGKRRGVSGSTAPTSSTTSARSTRTRP